MRSIIISAALSVCACAADLSSFAWKHFGAEHGIGTVTALAAKGGSIYIGTQKGVFRMSGTNIAPEKRIAETFISALLALDDDIWAGSPEGLYLYLGAIRKTLLLTKKEGLLSSEITALAYDESFVYIGTKWGINCYDRRTKQLSTRKYTVINGLPSNKVYALHAAPSYLLVGTEKGLAWKKKFEASFETPEKESNIKEIRINAVALVENTAFAATDGDGVYRIDIDTLAFTRYDASSGKIPDNFVNDICADGRYIWVATFDGGACYDRTADSWAQCTDVLRKGKSGSSDVPMNVLLTDGENVYAGIEGFGLSVTTKNVPGLTLSPYLAYRKRANAAGKPAVLFIYGTASGASPVKQVTIACRDALSRREITSGMTVERPRVLEHTGKAGFSDDIIAAIDLSESRLAARLWDLIVDVVVTDEAGNENKVSQLFLYDGEAPSFKYVSFKEYTDAETALIEGRCRDASLSSLEVVSNAAVVERKEMLNTFSVSLPLQEGVNRYTMQAADVCGNVAAYEIKIIRDTLAPVIALESSEVAVPWENDVLTIPYKEENIDDKQVYIVKEGKRFMCDVNKGASTITAKLAATDMPRKHVLTVYDLAGHRTEYPFNLFRSAEMVDILLDPVEPVTKKPVETFRGKLFSKSDASVAARDAGNAVLPIAYNRSGKTFSLECALAPGTNIITLFATNAAGFTREKRVSIVHTPEARTLIASVDTPRAVQTNADNELVERMKRENEDLRKRNEELAKAEAKAAATPPKEKVVYRTIENEIPEQSPAIVLVSMNFANENALSAMVNKYYGNPGILEWVLAVNASIPNEQLKQRGKIVVPNKKMVEFLILNKKNDSLLRRIRSDAYSLFTSGGANRLYTLESLLSQR
ncbi:MAG: hypothetical protein AABZ39_03080 [Spirochaetota bacterium]